MSQPYRTFRISKINKAGVKKTFTTVEADRFELKSEDSARPSYVFYVDERGIFGNVKNERVVASVAFGYDDLPLEVVDTDMEVRVA